MRQFVLFSQKVIKKVGILFSVQDHSLPSSGSTLFAIQAKKKCGIKCSKILGHLPYIY